MFESLAPDSATWQKVSLSQKLPNLVPLISMKWLGIVFFMLLFLAFSSERAFGKPLTLKDTLDYAMEHSPLLGNTKKREHISQLEVSNRKAAFLPKLDVTSTHGLETTDPKTSSTDPWASRYQLTLSENLYDNHQSIIQYDRAKLEREIAEMKTLRQKNALTFDIIRLFYGLSKNIQRTEAKEEQYRTLQKQVESVSYQYKQGLKMRKDFLRLKSELQTADIELRAASNERERARFDLEKAIGVPPSENFEFQKVEVEETKIPTSPPAMEKTFEYVIGKMERDLSPFDVTLAERKYWPEVNLSGTAYYGANSYLKSNAPYSQNDALGANVLLSLNFNLWDWGTLKREVEKARVGVEIADNDLRQLSLQTNNDIKALMLDINNLQANHNLTRELLENQENAFKILEREYRDGQTTYYDYVTALSNKLRARTLLWDTRFDLASAIAKYRYYERTLYANYFTP